MQGIGDLFNRVGEQILVRASAKFTCTPVIFGGAPKGPITVVLALLIVVAFWVVA